MTKRKKWPEDAETARENAIASALEVRSSLKRAMELLEQGKAIPVAIAIYQTNARNERVIQILREAKETKEG